METWFAYFVCWSMRVSDITADHPFCSAWATPISVQDFTINRISIVAYWLIAMQRLRSNGRYLAAVRQQQLRNGVFGAVRAYGCSRNNEIRHATSKQELHCQRKGIFCAVRAEMLWAVTELPLVS
jgi:hypothetical protein